MAKGIMIESVVKRERVFSAISDITRAIQKDARESGNPDVMKFANDLVESLEGYEEGILEKAGII